MGGALELGRRVVSRLAIVPIRLRGLVLGFRGAYLAFSLGGREAGYVLYSAGIGPMARAGLWLACGAAAGRRETVRLSAKRREERDGAVPDETRNTVATLHHRAWLNATAARYARTTAFIGARRNQT